MLVLIDNYDSFTYNIVNAFCALGANLKIYYNDQANVEAILAEMPHGVIIGPGPGAPPSAGVSLDLIKMCGELRIPLFGICLGMQAIGEAFGGYVVRAQHPMHGKVSQIFHTNEGVFRGLKQGIAMTRYHSLIVDRDRLPACLRVTAETDKGEIMALHHQFLPIQGVQFHPEGVASEGEALLKNAINWMCQKKE